MARRVLLRDIAAEAGVSTSVVSFVLTDQAEKRRVGEATAERVRAAARKLGYVPSLAAKRLRYAGERQEPLTIAIVTSLEASLALLAPLMRGVQRVVGERAADDRPVHISIETFHHKHLDRESGFADGSRYNGAILSNTMPEDDAFLADFDARVPLVLFNRIIPGYSAVVADEERVGRQAARDCLAAGRRIAFLKPRDRSQAVQRRCEAFRDALADQGVEPHELVCPGLQEFSARRVVHEALADGTSFDALYAATGLLADGARAAMSFVEAGERMRLVGEGDARLALYDPKRNAFSHSGLVMGEVAAGRLLAEFDPDPPAAEVIRFVAGREKTREVW